MLLECLYLKLINFFWTEFSEFKFSSPSSLSYKVDELINNIWGILMTLKFGLVCEKISKKRWIFDEFNVLFLNCKNKMTFNDFWMMFFKIYITFLFAWLHLTQIRSNTTKKNIKLSEGQFWSTVSEYFSVSKFLISEYMPKWLADHTKTTTVNCCYYFYLLFFNLWTL